MPTIDLHLHTHYSDGKFSPEEIVCHADELGLAAIAITDHDNTRGARQALPLARSLGIELVPAIEFTSRWPGCAEDVDVLGYFVDLENREFQAFERAALNDARARIAACCARLTAQGCPLSLDDVLAENPRYAGLLQLTLAYQKKGYADNWDAALRPVGQAWQAGRLSQFTITQVIEQIHRAGGVAVLAHPTVITFGDGRIKAEQLAALVEAGLDGIEIYHHRLDAGAQAYFLDLAHQFDLAVSGGSDEHGWHDGFKRMGTQPVTLAMLEALRARRAI
jgi:hypothetical protein